MQTTKGFKVFEIREGKVIDEIYISCNDNHNHNGIQPQGNGNDEHEVKQLEQSLLSCIDDCQIVIANGLSKLMFEELVKEHKEAFITEASSIRGAINHFISQTLRNHPEIA